MAAMFNQRPRGLFGNMVQQAGQTPGYGDGVREQMAQAPVGMGQPAPTEQGKPAFFGQGGIGRAIAGNIGDVLLQQSGMAPLYNPAMQQQRKEALAAQQAQADRENRFTDWRRQYDYERANPAPSSAQPYRTEDNAGNVWEMGADGQFKPVFVDPNDKTYMQDGQMITVPNVVRQQQAGGQSGGPPATLPPEFDFGEGAAPNMANTPSPGLNPTTLSAAQYQAIVAAKGKAATDAWAARNGVRIEGR